MNPYQNATVSATPNQVDLRGPKLTSKVKESHLPEITAIGDFLLTPSGKTCRAISEQQWETTCTVYTLMSEIIYGIWNISPSCRSIVACNLLVLEKVKPHVICLLSSCLSGRCTVPSCYSQASTTSPSAPRSHIEQRRLANISSLVLTWLLWGLATKFRITVALTTDAPKQ